MKLSRKKYWFFLNWNNLKIRYKFNVIWKLLVVFIYKDIIFIIKIIFLITLLIVVCACVLFFFHQIPGYPGPRGISPKGEKGKSGPRGLNNF